jgi:hypothetical protein
MPALDKTNALMAAFAETVGLPPLPRDENGGFHLTIGGTTDIYIYGGDDQTILLVAPIAPLPEEPEYGLMLYLFRNNLFDSDSAPFQIAADESGVLVFWGHVDIADLDGTMMASLVDRVAERVEEIRGEIGSA